MRWYGAAASSRSTSRSSVADKQPARTQAARRQAGDRDEAQGAGVADARRDQMLAAAARLIAERGFSDTRIADVAERIGSSPALVIYYFGTKDSLLTEALRWSERSFYAAVEEMLGQTAAAADRIDRLVAWCLPDRTRELPRDWGL